MSAHCSCKSKWLEDLTTPLGAYVLPELFVSWICFGVFDGQEVSVYAEHLNTATQGVMDIAARAHHLKGGNKGTKTSPRRTENREELIFHADTFKIVKRGVLCTMKIYSLLYCYRSLCWLSVDVF